MKYNIMRTITLEQYANNIGYTGKLLLEDIKEWALKELNWKIQDKKDEEDMTVEQWCAVSINGNIRYLGV